MSLIRQPFDRGQQLPPIRMTGILFDNKPVNENPEVKAQMVYIPDGLYFFSQYSVEETAKFYAKIYPE